MSFNWPEFSIDELKAPTKGAIAMGPFGSRIKAENFVDSGVPVLKGGNLHGAYINDSDCDFLTEEKAEELKSSVVYEGDIVITHRGTIGQVSIVSDESKYPRYVVSQSQLKISLDKTKVNPYYVNYYLRSRLGQYQLLSFASQVGVPAIAKASTSVKQIRVPCPPLSEL
ncbi:restriction endonuclease subunit S [Vibrio europaeus]|uniref:restriction endonuclease subunit S n=1 Tax=Vibrio europaeus TaxID=300876 RepID=UPI0023408F87|nr:restriction endonuclease subunit S [Vibrio europaeus]MDC5852407.1 restriction endonuclease subunit S [Vibrio europaeus]